MADSTEDLRREMEEFEQSENSEVVTGAAIPEAPARKRIPTWVYWMVAADVLIAVVIVLVVVAL